MSDGLTPGARTWAEENIALFEIDAESVAVTIDEWRSAVEQAAGITGVIVAGPLQRHLTARGTGLPGSFCLAVTGDEVIAFKLNPRNPEHPYRVAVSQIKDRVKSWPRRSVRATDVEVGKLAYGVTLEIDGESPVPCRTPKGNGNAAATMLIMTLGGTFPGR